MTERLFEGADWDFRTLQRITDACEEVATKDLGLDVYPNQIEVITAEQMLDSYSSIGMPLMYRHWSFGKRFARDEAYYKRGMSFERLGESARARESYETVIKQFPDTMQAQLAKQRLESTNKPSTR